MENQYAEGNALFKFVNSSEIVLLKKPLIAALEAPIKRQIIKNQHDSFRTRRSVEKDGGVDAVTKSLAHDFVKSFVKTAFTGGKLRPMAEPFICSFCSHANDHQYEQANGLLSQWRGYGRKGDGRFALVFDTQGLDNLLAREWRAHFWVKLDLAEVVYLDGPATLETMFPELLQEALAFISDMLEGRRDRRDSFLIPFFQAATVLKHRGFREEREVRIVAIPQSKQVLADHGKEDDLIGWPPVKEAHTGGIQEIRRCFQSLSTPICQIKKSL